MPQSNRSSAARHESVLALCYGTRPQTIKASVLRRAFQAVGPVLTIDTGQHYDYELNALLYAELGVDPPDICLDVGSSSHAEQTASVLVGTERHLRGRGVRGVVVIGDTNSTLGCTLAAVKLRLPVVHVEAGLRAADPLMAEEINRRAVDAVATLLCTPSATATAAVREERRDAMIVETGDVARDVLEQSLGLAAHSEAITGLRDGDPYVFATLHRAELTSQPALLARILDQLAASPFPVILPIHPRTRAALCDAGLNSESRGALRILPAVGYLESLGLARDAEVILTDSGGIQREAYWLGVPCITLRSETEWRETVDCGANQLLPPELATETLRRAIERRVSASRGEWSRDAYGAGNAAARVAAAVSVLD